MPNILEIKFYGCDILVQKAETVSEVTPEIKHLIEDMIYTMYHYDGIGLAAPQVGVAKKIFVCDIHYSKTTEKNPIVFINPEYIDIQGELIYEEGCLSFPDVFEKVKRFETVKVLYQDESFETQTIEADDLFAVVIQHEMDHLNGILLYDKMNALRRMSQSFKLSKINTKSKKMTTEKKIVEKHDKPAE
jgi:peptide deformylase